MKVCTSCNTPKNVIDYHKPSRSVCKSCVAQAKKDKQAQYDEYASTIKKTCRLCNESKDGTCFRFDSNQCRQCILKKQNRVTNRPSEDMPAKICSKCNEEKEATSFRYRTNVCKECEKKDMYVWRKENPEKFKMHLQKYRSSESYLQQRRVYLKDKYHEDICVRISQLFRTRMRSAIQGHIKYSKTLEILGCSVESAKKWLEFNFTEEMSWDNFGTYWHIDHIKPCASFDFSQEDQQQECFHWTNIAPLLKLDNLKKGAKVDDDYIQKMQQRAHEFKSANPDIFI